MPCRLRAKPRVVVALGEVRQHQRAYATLSRRHPGGLRRVRWPYPREVGVGIPNSTRHHQVDTVCEGVDRVQRRVSTRTRTGPRGRATSQLHVPSGVSSARALEQPDVRAACVLALRSGQMRRPSASTIRYPGSMIWSMRRAAAFRTALATVPSDGDGLLPTPRSVEGRAWAEPANIPALGGVVGYTVARPVQREPLHPPGRRGIGRREVVHTICDIENRAPGESHLSLRPRAGVGAALTVPRSR